jgi:hypothetical protein
VRTKPIPGGAGWDTAAGAWDTGKMCETNPIWPGLGGARAPAGERCETNPICRSRQQAGVGRLCKTNPIPGRAGWVGDRGTRANPAKRSQFGEVRLGSGGLIVRNEPNLPQTGREDHRQGQRAWRCHPSGGNCAKRTQFGGAVYRTEQTQFRGVGGRRNTHHSTMLSFHHSNPMPIVQNEPNSRQGDGGRGASPSVLAPVASGLPWPDCAKRTQFPAGPGGTGPGGRGAG